MRLTLRTMLAYLDDILEPQDAQALGQKIDESEFAKNLMHRIRDVTRRLRLPAPKLDGRGMGLDANTVAEYLDSILAPERLLDFEKVCLESDVHLAEVASAHQILALVLGEPAEIEAHTRQRMYGLVLLSETSDSKPEAVAAAADTPATVPLTAAATNAAATNKGHVKQLAVAAVAPSREPAAEAGARKKPEIPEYLREEPSGGWWKLAAAAVVLIVIGGFYWIWSQSSSLNDEVVLNPEGQNAVVPSGSGTSSETIPKAAPEGAAKSATTAPPSISQPVPSQPKIAATETEVPVPPSPNPLPKLPSSETTPAPTPPVLPPVVPPTVPVTPAPATTPSTTAATPAVPMPVATTTPPALPPLVPAPATPGTTPAATSPAKTPATPAPPAAVPAATNPPATPPVEVARDGIGRSMSTELMLRFNRQNKTWHRLANQEKLFSGDRLLVLPTDRANMDLGGNPVTMLEGASIEVKGPDEQGVLNLNVLEGRLLLLAQINRPGTRVLLRFGDREGLLTFVDPDASVALDVARVRVEGTNPETEPATTLADLYVLGGTVSWLVPGAQQAELIKAGMRRALDGRPTSAAPAQVPGWVAKDDVNPLDKRGSAAIKEKLTSNQPASVILKELSDDTRSEVSLMALQSLALIEEFDWLVKRLNEPAQRGALLPPSPRLGLIDSLRSALNRGPEVAQRLRQSLETPFGRDKGDELYRMLWGYSPQQLKEGSAKRLVDFLENEDAAIRTLSFWNLRHIMAGSTFGYQPFDNPGKRQLSVQRWRQKLDLGQIPPPEDGKTGG